MCLLGRRHKVTAGIVIAIGISFVAYGIYDLFYARPQLSPASIDEAADVDSEAAWMAGVIVAFGFAGGLFLYAFRSIRNLGEKVKHAD